MIVVSIAAIAGGATAAVLGFGIGTLITPSFAIEFSFRDAVIMASIPHFVATSWRLWILRRSIDLATLKTFGLASAAGGFVGAFALGRSSSFLLQFVFGLLLMVGGISGISARWGRSIEFRGRAVWVAGGIAGLLGGMVGNQGGIRTAAMLGVDIAKYQFVATATAVALIIDVVRLPIYIATAPSLVAAARAIDPCCRDRRSGWNRDWALGFETIVGTQLPSGGFGGDNAPGHFDHRPGVTQLKHLE